MIDVKYSLTDGLSATLQTRAERSAQRMWDGAAEERSGRQRVWLMDDAAALAWANEERAAAAADGAALSTAAAELLRLADVEYARLRSAAGPTVGAGICAGESSLIAAAAVEKSSPAAAAAPAAAVLAAAEEARLWEHDPTRPRSQQWLAAEAARRVGDAAAAVAANAHALSQGASAAAAAAAAAADHARKVQSSWSASSSSQLTLSKAQIAPTMEACYSRTVGIPKAHLPTTACSHKIDLVAALQTGIAGGVHANPAHSGPSTAIAVAALRRRYAVITALDGQLRAEGDLRIAERAADSVLAPSLTVDAVEALLDCNDDGDTLDGIGNCGRGDEWDFDSVGSHDAVLLTCG